MIPPTLVWLSVRLSSRRSLMTKTLIRGAFLKKIFGGKRAKEQESRGLQSPGGRADYPQPDNIVAVNGIVPIAEGRATGIWIEVPTTAAHHSF